MVRSETGFEKPLWRHVKGNGGCADACQTSVGCPCGKFWLDYTVESRAGA